MEPTRVSNPIPNSSLEPTPEEVEAGACLTQAPEQLESRAPAEPPPLPPAVQGLIDKHSPPPTALPPKGQPHDGMVLGIGANLALGVGPALGGEVGVGVVIDFTEPKLSLFTSHGAGLALATGVSAGLSGQAAVVNDVQKFWGSGAEVGLNVEGGGAVQFTKPSPDGTLEFNGIAVSAGPSIGGDLHYFEGTTSELWSLSLQDVENTMRQLSGLRRFGP